MRRPTLYKDRGTWYARFWDEEKGKYFARSLGVPVEGKRERRREADESATKLAESFRDAEKKSLKRRVPSLVSLLCL